MTESKQQQQQPQSPMPDIDSGDKDNELAASEYVNDIFAYYKRVEPTYRVSPSYMSRQVSLPTYIVCILNYVHQCMATCRGVFAACKFGVVEGEKE